MHPVTARKQAVERPRIYSHEYYDRIRKLEEGHWWYAGMREIAAALLRSQCGTGTLPRVLDAGCGTGAAMAWVRTAVGASRVTGMDVSAYALGFCRGRGEQSLAQCSVTAMPFRDACVDLVLCNDVLQHLATDGGDAGALKEVFRLLRPGGLALLRTNSRFGRSGGARVDTDFQHYDLGQLVDRVRGAGFVVRRASHANMLPLLYALLKGWLAGLRSSGRGHHHGTLCKGLDIREDILNRRWLNRLLLFVLVREAQYLSRSNRSLPFGHTIVCLALKPR